MAYYESILFSNYSAMISGGNYFSISLFARMFESYDSYLGQSILSMNYSLMLSGGNGCEFARMFESYDSYLGQSLKAGTANTRTTRFRLKYQGE